MYQRRVIGLTGSIGMGKSYVTKLLRRRHVPVFDADAEAHRILKLPEVVKLIGQIWPLSTAVANGVIDRRKLGDVVFNSAGSRQVLEDIVAVYMNQAVGKFIRESTRRRAKCMVLDMPLLLEKYDAAMLANMNIVVVSAPGFIQKQRVLARPGMTEEKFEKIKALQISDYWKRRAANHIISSGLNRRHTYRQVNTLLKSFLG